MAERFYFSRPYYVYPLSVLLIVALVAEYSSRTTAALADLNLLFSAIFYLALYTLFAHGTYCEITSGRVSRVSYFFVRKSILINDIASMAFPPTWIVTPQARTLLIVANDGRYITMTDAAYTRPVLVRIVKLLLAANSRLKLDDDVRDLLKLS